MVEREMVIQHFSHHHALELDLILFDAFCGICNRLIQQERMYFCRRCLYFIHETCAEFPEYIKHSLHPLHPLKLAKRSLNNDNCCYYCEEPFNKDEHVYGCDDHLCYNFYMHRTCAMVPLPTITSQGDGGEDLDVLQYACHQKPMILTVHPDHNERRATCFVCRLDYTSGSTYSCKSINCKNFLHKSCAELPQKIQHPFHSHHTLILQVGNRSCRSCCKKSSRLIFSCHESGCNFNLGIECASQNITIKHRSHDHSLALVEKSSCVIQCEACQKSYKNLDLKEINHTQSFIFRCMDCDFNYHFLCGPLPPTIKFEYHMHRLILSDHSVTKDDLDQYYCEVCEEEMDQSFCIYYCEECKYAAHVHCLISEIMKVIKGDTNDVELKTLGEHRWDQYLAVESMGHQHVQVNKTLKDIMDTLTEQEIEMLKNPFSFDNPSRKIRRINRHIYFQQRNSRFNLEGSNEDIDRLLQFFLFNTNGGDFDNFCRELWWFLPEEGLLKLLDEKYLRQQVEDVDGFMVPKTLALVLKSLLHKYGDLGGWKSLSSAMKSIASTLLCVVLDKMCKTKMEDVTRDDLKHFCFYITGIRNISGFSIGRFYKDQFEPGFSLKAFLGFEAIKYEKETCKNLDNKIVLLEAELERCKANREKFKIQRSQKSDFIKECLSEASAWKNKYFGDTWF